jgi:hypothetical protein
VHLLIVVACHALAIGAGREHSEHVAVLGLLQRYCIRFLLAASSRCSQAYAWLQRESV